MIKVGITMRLDFESRRFYLGRDYCEALVEVGATPLLISLIPDSNYVASCLDVLDGILIPGSDTDVDPKRFGEEPHPKLKRVMPEKEETDFLVLEEAHKRCMPILAICYGMQILNVWRGGTLYQDIEAQVAGAIKHEQGSSLGANDWASHSIRLRKNCLLGEFASDNVLEGAVVEEMKEVNEIKEVSKNENDDRNEKEREKVRGKRGKKAEGKIEEGEDFITVRVNSHHHQAVKDVGKGLEVYAWAKDGIIEAIGNTDLKSHFVLGIQWHPELLYRKSDFNRKIFEVFVERCREYEKKRQVRYRKNLVRG